MNSPVDHDAMQAALALLMLSQDTRHLQQNVDPDTEDDDCIITHIRPVVHHHHQDRRPETQQVGVTPARPVVHRYHPYRRIEPRPVGVTPARSRASLDAEPSGIPEPAPVQQPAPARDSLPDQRLSLTQSPSHEDDTPPAILYSLKSLVFQALLAAPTGAWLSARDVADYIKDKCPQLFEARGDRVCRSEAYRIMRRNTQYLERSVGGRDTIVNPNRWRLAEGARDTAILLAWRITQAGQPPASPQPSGQAVSDIPYTHKAMTLQALLAAPEGRWLHSSELTDYINAQYPQLLQEKGRRRMRDRTTGVLAEISDLCEKYVPENGKLSPVYWRLAPGAREEATRLAWRERKY